MRIAFPGVYVNCNGLDEVFHLSRPEDSERESQNIYSRPRNELYNIRAKSRR